MRQPTRVELERVCDGGDFWGRRAADGGRKEDMIIDEEVIFKRRLPGGISSHGHYDYEGIVLTGWQLLVTAEVKSSTLLPL